MQWQEVVAIIVVLLGLGAGAFLIAQRPAFWVDLVARVLKALWPMILKAIPIIGKWLAKRNTPEVEEAMRECVRRGGEWDNFNKKCKF